MKKMLFLVSGWAVGLFIVSYFGLSLFPSNQITGKDQNEIFWVQPQEFTYWSRWKNWDANAYLTIARNGYNDENLLVFFPFYSFVIAVVNTILHNDVAAGIGISLSSLVITLWLLKKLVSLDYSEEVADLTTNVILTFPLAFFLMAPYTESLFLLLAVSTYYLFRKKNNWFMVTGGLATMTKIVGVALIPALIVELLQSKAVTKRQQLLSLGKITTMISGLFMYFFINYWQTGSFFTFFEIQRTHFDRILGVNIPFRVLFSYANSLIIHPGNRFLTRDSTIIALEFVVSIIFFILIFAGWKRVRKSYLMFASIAWSIPLMSGRTGSMLRYVLILFPCYIVIAHYLQKYPRFHQVYFFVSTLLLALFTVSFINGYWVA